MKKVLDFLKNMWYYSNQEMNEEMIKISQIESLKDY